MALLACAPEGPIVHPASLLAWGPKWKSTDPGKTFQSGFLFQNFQAFVVFLFTNHYGYLILAAVHIQKVQQSNQVTTCHHSLGKKLGSNKILLILRKMVPCDQSREQCSVTAKSPPHLSILWFACISFFPPSIFLPRLFPPLHLCWSVMFQCIL